MEQFKALVLVGVLMVVWTFLPHASCLALEQRQSAQFWVIHNWRDECWHFKEDCIFSVWFMSASWPHLPKSKIMWRISFFLLPDVPSFLQHLKITTVGISPQWWFCHHVLWRVGPVPDTSEGGEEHTGLAFPNPGLQRGWPGSCQMQRSSLYVQFNLIAHLAKPHSSPDVVSQHCWNCCFQPPLITLIKPK